MAVLTARELADQIATIAAFNDAQRAALIELLDTETYASQAVIAQVVGLMEQVRNQTVWTPEFALEADGDRTVMAIVDWTGGVGTKPDYPRYIGEDGLVETAGEAVNLKGDVGPAASWGSITGALSDQSDLAAALSGYLPLSGGVLTGALRVVAGVALAVGLAVGADAGTGLYSPASQKVGIAAGGQNVATFEAGIATVAGVVKPDADATRDLGTVSARWRDAFLSRNLTVGGSATIDTLNVGRGANGVVSNTAFGRSALVSSSLSGAGNTAVGYFALSAVTTGAANVAIGREALIALDTGSYNFAAGYQALYSTLAGVHNVAIGYQALYSMAGVAYNIGIGREALKSNSTGAGNIGIGYAADINRTAGNYNIVIGHGLVADSTTADNQINIGGKYFHDRILLAGPAYLYAEAANTLALRNGTNAQELRLYGTYTDGSNYGRLRAYLNGATWTLQTQAAGTGAATALSIESGGNLSFGSGGTANQWRISTGTFGPVADASYDLASSSARVRDGWFSRDVRAGGNVLAGATGYVGFTGRTLLAAPTDGFLQITNNAGTGVGGIRLGPATGSFPLLKVSGAIVQARLGDDSGFTRIQGIVRTHANAVAETPTATHTITIEDASGTAYKVLAVVA